MTNEQLNNAADAHAREAAKDYGVFWQDAYNIAHKAFKAGAAFNGEWIYLPELPEEGEQVTVAYTTPTGALNYVEAELKKGFWHICNESNFNGIRISVGFDVYAWREIQPVEPPPLPNTQSFDHKTEEK